MKVVAFNGSPHPNGNTYKALCVVCEELRSEGVETEIIQVGNRTLAGCTGCNACKRNGGGECVFADEEFLSWMEKMRAADGILLGSPVHYASIGGAMTCFLDRAFYSNGRNFAYKVGASVAVLRRSGGVFSFDQLNHYFMISEMPVASSRYWNVVHGHGEGSCLEDEEGVLLLKVLGQNMAWLLRLMEHGKGAVSPPKEYPRVSTNFIR